MSGILKSFREKKYEISFKLYSRVMRIFVCEFDSSERKAVNLVVNIERKTVGDEAQNQIDKEFQEELEDGNEKNGKIK